jgi:hypothetical protein
VPRGAEHAAEAESRLDRIAGVIAGVYTRAMRPPIAISWLACVSLVALQLGGVHMHIGRDGYVGMPQGPHSHSQHSHRHSSDGGIGGSMVDLDSHSSDHDYDGTTDVSITKLSAAAKELLAVVLLILAVPLLLRQAPRIRPIIAVRVLSGRRTRWRPPLRAPPRLV